MRIGLDVFREHGEWPSFNHVDSELDRQGIAAKRVLESIPYGWVFPDKRSQGGVTYVGPHEEVGVRVVGLHHLQDADDILALFFKGLRWAIEMREAFRMPSPTEYVEPKWTFNDFLLGLGGAETPIKLNDAVLVLTLMRWERDVPSWGGPTDDPYGWEIRIDLDIKEYRDLKSVEEYVHFRQLELREWLQPRGAVGMGGFLTSSEQESVRGVEGDRKDAVGPTAEMAGALARFWSGGGGPSHSAISTAFSLAGLEEDENAFNKEDRVRMALRSAEPEIGQRIVGELLDLLRATGAFDEGSVDTRVDALRRSFERGGFALSPDGFVDWETSGPTWEVQTAEEELPQLTDTEFREVAIPTPALLMQALQRLPLALKSLTSRRRNRSGLRIQDEYDLQDAVEAVLRALYNDVRAEERTPSSAGSSSAIDFLLRDDQIAIEVKMTHPRRSEKAIKPEILVDIEDYQKHPAVRHLIVVIYDVADSFRNPRGFETDLSGRRGKLDIQVQVVGWPLRIGESTQPIGT